MHPCFRHLLPTVLALSVATSLSTQAPVALAQSDDAPVFAGGNPAVKDAKIEALNEPEMLRWVKAVRSGNKKLAKKIIAERMNRGERAREANWNEDAPSNKATTPFGVSQPPQIDITPANIPVSNPAGDGAGAGQSEEDLAIEGQYGLCAWNDGQGFIVPPDVQGWGYTTNAGASWVDAGVPAKAGATGGTISDWFSDPVVVSNPATGTFYYCGLINLPGSQNGVAIVPVTFPAGVFTPGTPHVVIAGSNSTDAYDKQWMAVDPLTGILYVTYTHFTVGGGNIQIQRSLDGGVTWSAQMTLNLGAANGLVQGSQVDVDKLSNVYVSWYEIGPIDVDFIKIRKSTNNAVSFAAEVTSVSFFTNFGAGCPGFNRLRSIDNPMMGIDKSTGPNANRVHIAVSESINWYDDGLGGGGPKSEVEPNGTVATATPFTPGQRLRGSLAAASPSPDYWSFSATAGTTYIFWCDSLSLMQYTLRIFCTDGVTSLQAGGDNALPNGGQAFLVWTAPTTATYTMRVASISGTLGGYRIQSGINGNPGAGAEVAHDHRDIFVTRSDNGTVWSAKTRANDEAAFADNFLPAIQVPCDGYPYVYWYDFRGAANCQGLSHCYTSRSVDGNATWQANQAITTVATNWNTTSSNIAPNLGDYIGLHGSTLLSYSWADGRVGTPDVWSASVDPGFTLSCPSPSVITAPESGTTTVNSTASVNNSNTLYGNTYSYSATNSRGWAMTSASGSVAAGALSSAGITIGLVVPDSAVSGTVDVCFTVVLNSGAKTVQCCTTYPVDHPVAVAATVVEATGSGSTARVSWWVGEAGPVTIERSRDGSVWTALDTRFPDGSQRVSYEDATVTPGHYSYRLAWTRDGSTRYAGQVWIEVSANVSFALRGVHPNPVMRDAALAVSFSLPDDAPATIEVLDLGGRRILQRGVGSMGAGSHVLRLTGTSQNLPSGLYIVRLSRAGKRLTSKFSVIQ